MNSELAQDETLVHEFLIESEELLQQMDQDMIALESMPTDGDLLNRIFRTMHTIKGTAGFLGFSPIIRLSHSAEDVLNALRRGDVRLCKKTMDALLAARDQLGVMLEDIRAKRSGQYDLDLLLHELESVQHPTGEPPRLGEILSQTGTVPAQDVQAALDEQQTHPEATREKLGEILIKSGKASASQVGAALIKQKQQANDQQSASTMRVDVHKLDELINLVGELVLERNRLVRISRDFSSARNSGLDTVDAALSQSAARMSFITDELQAAGLRTRMIPIDTVFRKFPRMIRDLAQAVGKDVELSMVGQETEIDKTMVELIGDPLVHLVRNSLDHGIESPADRERAGKKKQGAIKLEACQEGDRIVITVADDGAGINPAHVAQKAVEKGLITAERLKTLTTREIHDFIFLPGFSTAASVSNLSGRGVGMDVVRSNLRKLNGTVELDSVPGEGTRVRLRLPLTLAILPVLLVRVASEIYALPLRSVLETVRVAPDQLHKIEDHEVVQLRGQTLSLLRLSEFFEVVDQTCGAEHKKAVILSVGEQQVALLVDELIGQESTVIKPLNSCLTTSSSLAGATISGDGRVRLVLDPAGLIASASNPPGPGGNA